MLKRNVGSSDRIIRLVLGVALLAYFLLVPDSPWRWVGLIGVVPLLTALLGSCPIYTVLGLSTCPARAGGHAA